jgi:hypothetical protein
MLIRLFYIVIFIALQFECVVSLAQPEDERKKNSPSSQQAKGSTLNSIDSNTGTSSDLSRESTSIQQQKLMSTNFLIQKKNASTQFKQRSPTDFQQNEMNKIVEFYNLNFPNSFEFHFYKYLSGNHNTNLGHHLIMSNQLIPKNQDVKVQLVAYNFITNNISETKSNLAYLKKSNFLTDETIEYARNLLKSTLEKGILMTHGIDDTYGVLYVQLNENFRKDVKLISLDFMQSEYYRESLLKNDNFHIPKSTTVNDDFLAEFCSKNGSKNIQISLTFPKPYFEKMIEKLNVIGLTFVYDKDISEVHIFNEKLYKDFREQTLTSNKLKSDKFKRLEANYLPMLFYLRKSYLANHSFDLVGRN